MWCKGVDPHVHCETLFSVDRTICTKCGDEPRCVGQRWGRLCRNAYRRANRPKYSELSERDRARDRCRSYTNTLIKRGHLTRGCCKECGTDENVQAHHEDYADPRTVEWVCAKCHRALHQVRRVHPAGMTLADILAKHLNPEET